MERKAKSGGEGEEKPFLDHLEDLRWLLLKIFFSWGIFSLIAFLLAPQVLTVVKWPLFRMLGSLGRGGEAEVILRSLSPAEVFLMSVRLSFLAGLIISLPLILYFTAKFILPALKPDEKRFLVPAFCVGGGLFFFGALFAYGVVLPLSLKFFWKFSERLGVQPAWTVNNYASLVGKLILAFGIIFEIPVLILFLAKLGIVDYDMLKRGRPYVIVGVFLLAALLTPPDIITQIMMAVPMLILYELCIFFSRFFTLKRTGKKI